MRVGAPPLRDRDGTHAFAESGFALRRTPQPVPAPEPEQEPYDDAATRGRIFKAQIAGGGQRVLGSATVGLLALDRGLEQGAGPRQPDLGWERALPRRLLTVDARPATRGGWDNELLHAIVAVGDVVRTSADSDACEYQVLDTLGAGTFASVFSCTRLGTHDDTAPRLGALKIVRNTPAYGLQALQELRILQLLNQQHDPDDTHHIVRLHKAFTYRSHVCFVFEPLGCSLLDMVAGSGYRGLPLQQVRPMMIDMMDALGVLANAGVVHADLKPENVLMLPEPGGMHLKLIDFGSAVITTEHGPKEAPSHYHQSVCARSSLRTAT